jgi:hypothetical protein
MMREERREGYSGAAELHADDGDKLGDANVTLSSWVTIIDDQGTTGSRRWSGSLTAAPTSLDRTGRPQ